MKYKKLSILSICTMLAMTASMAMAQSNTGGFSSNNISAYVEAPEKYNASQVMMGKVPGIKGQFALGIKAVKDVTLKPMAVKPDTKYSLKMRARYDGSESVEENQHFETFLTFGERTKLVPQREIVFLDAQGKRISSLITGMAFRQWFEYNDVFYTPPETASISVLLDSGIDEITCFIDGISLSKVEGEAAINISPVVNDLGRYNYSGWQHLSAGARRLSIDGKVYFNPQYGSFTPYMPLSEPGEYKMVSKSTNCGPAATIAIRMYDAQGKSTGQVNMGTGHSERSFILPANTAKAQFMIRSALLEELYLLRVDSTRK